MPLYGKVVGALDSSSIINHSIIFACKGRSLHVEQSFVSEKRMQGRLESFALSEIIWVFCSVGPSSSSGN